MIRILMIAAILCILGAGGAYFLTQVNNSSRLAVTRPQVEAVAPLEPATRLSNLVIPITVPLDTLAKAANASVPPMVVGSKSNPLPSLLREGQIDYMIERGPLAFAPQGGGLMLTSDLKGDVRVTGQGAGGVAQGIGNLVGGRLGQQLQNVRFDQKVAIAGRVMVQARPQLTKDWHVAPNLSGKVALKDVPLSVAGVKLNIARELQPFVDHVLTNEMNKVDADLRTDNRLLTLARQEWGHLCLSRALPATTAGAPPLFIEVKPIKAVAAQPAIDSAGVHLILGLRAQTRILSQATKPDCPFPDYLELIGGRDPGGINIALPIDVPFSELNKLLTAQLAGKTFPEDQTSAANVKVRTLSVTPSGSRLLLALGVTVKERRFLGLSAEGDVYIWGRPELDRGSQTLKLVDLAIDVQSQAAFGLLDAAASAAIPYFINLLSERAQIDLKPFAADAKARIEAAAKQAQSSRTDVKITIAIDSLALQEIAFDATTLRVVAETRGQAGLSILSLPAR